MERAIAASFAILLLLVTSFAQTAPGDSLDKLAADFWDWRAQYQPYTADDIPRLEHPPEQVRDWSGAAVVKQRSELAAFETRWERLNDPSSPIARQVDYRLIGSALARVRWELDRLRRWQRDPNFYLEQTLTPVAEALMVPGPYEEAHSREILARVNNIPSILLQARANLVSPPAPLAAMAVRSLDKIRPRLEEMARSLAPEVRVPAARLTAASDHAATALEQYRDWLRGQLPALPAQFAVGRENYVFFLRKVALLPYSPEQLLTMSQRELERVLTFEELERQRDMGQPELSIAADVQSEVATARRAESAIRAYLVQHRILSVPDWIHHYTLRPMPAYVAALADFAETDDFTSPHRLDQDAIRYIKPPSPNLGYFWLAVAKDPRTDMVHEGVPGHYFQLALSWRHPDPIRRFYYDSGANEGIGFYAEEMMLQAGLFDDSPRSREIMYNFARLRALRVQVDVKLALGLFTIDQAADYLERVTPMNATSAHAEATEFAAWPGQKISYQIGKLQIMRMLSDARLRQGDAFSLQAFHDFVWLNGNVPIALQRWEYLGLEDEIKELENSW